MILEAAYMDDGSDERSSCPNIPFARRPHRVRSKVFDLSYAMSWFCRFQVYIASTVLSTALFSSLGELIDASLPAKYRLLCYTTRHRPILPLIPH